MQNPLQIPTWYPHCHGMFTSGTLWRLLNGCSCCVHIFWRSNCPKSDRWFFFSVDPLARRLEIHSKIVFRSGTDAFRPSVKRVRNALCVDITERLVSYYASRTKPRCLMWFSKSIKKTFFMYFSEIYKFFFLDSFFLFLYLFKMWEIFMPHPVFSFLRSYDLAVLEKDGEDQLDRSCEKWKSVT